MGDVQKNNIGKFIKYLLFDLSGFLSFSFPENCHSVHFLLMLTPASLPACVSVLQI